MAFAVVNQKKGLLVSPDYQIFGVEFPLPLEDDARLYFSTRDAAEHVCTQYTSPKFKVVEVV